MSISTNEVNYLVWRYLQEAGLELSAYALDDETEVNKLDKDYDTQVPLGCLIDLIQKGILYTKMKELVSSSETSALSQDQVINMNLNFLQSVHQLDGSKMEILSSNIKREESEDTKQTIPIEATQTPQNREDDFIRVINESITYDASFSVSFCPTNPDLIAWTQKGNSISTICSLSSTNKINLTLSTSSKETLIVSWASNGSQLVTGSENGELNLWSKEGVLKSVLAMHHWPVISLQWSPNGKYLTSLDVRNICIIWDIDKQSMLIHLDKDKWSSLDKFNIPLTDLTKNFGSVTCWIDDSKFITPGPNYTLLVNQITDDLNHKIIGVLIGHEYAICCLKYNDTLRLLVSASEDGTIRIFKGNSTNSLQILTGHSSAVTFVDFVQIHEQWYILSTSLDGSIRLWDFLKNELIDVACVDEGQAIINAAMHTTLSTKHTILATSDSFGAIGLWNVTDRIKQYAIYQHTPESYSSEIAFSIDGKKLAACYNSGQSVIINV